MEKEFFRKVNEYNADLKGQMRRAYDYPGNNLTPAQKDQSSEFCVVLETKTRIGMSAVYLFWDTVRRELEEDHKAGRVQEAVYQQLSAFIKTSYDLSTYCSEIAESYRDSKQAAEINQMAKQKFNIRLWTDPVLTLLKNNINSSALEPDTRTYVLQKLDKHKAAIGRHEQIQTQLRGTDLLEYWSAGKFNHHLPALTDPQETAQFKHYLAQAIKAQCTYGVAYPAENAGGVIDQLIDKAVDSFIQRVQAYEAPIMQRQQEIDRKQEEGRQAAAREKQTKESTQREQEKAAARERALEAIDKHRAFMANPQPYILAGEAGRVTTELDRVGSASASMSSAAKLLAGVIRSTNEKFDIRDPGIRELGEVIFSPTNLVLAARAFSVENPVKFVKISQSPWHGRAEQLRRLYVTSSAVRKLVSDLLQDDGGIVLLATLTRSDERCRKYANFLASNHDDCAIAEKQLREASAGLNGFLEEERKAFANEPEIKGLVRAYDDAQATLTKKHAELAEVRKALAQEIVQAFQGENIKRIPDAAVPEVRKPDVAVPNEWLSAMNGEFHFGEHTGKTINICSNEFPYMHSPVKLTAGLGKVREVLALLREEIGRHRSNLETMQQLCGTCGFELSAAEDKTTLRHSEYKIEVPLSGDEKAQKETLANAEMQFKEHMFQQRDILETAQHAGIQVEGADKAGSPISLQHEAFGRVTLAPRGYLSSDDFIALQNFLGQVQAKSQPAEAEVPVEAIPASTAPATWSPASGQTLVIFDANALKKLSALRGRNGHTWLDLIKQTARLPNVTVIIPSVVADFEARGQIPVYDEQGHRTGFERADPGFNDPRFPYLKIPADRVDQFLQSASRARIDGDTVHFEANANRNIIIMETPEDRALYEKIRKLPTNHRVDHLRQQVYGQGEGEAAITRIVKQLPFDCPFMIVSDDLAYFFNDAPRTSGKGAPVGQSSLTTYVSAETRERRVKLAKMMEEADALYLHQIVADMKAHMEGMGITSRRPFFPHNAAGVSQAGKGGQDMYALITEGCQMVDKGVRKTNGAPSVPNQGEHVNGSAGWSNTISRRSIAPDGVHDRPGPDLGLTA